MKKLVAVAALIGASAVPPTAANAQRVSMPCRNPGANPRPIFGFRVRPARCDTLGPFDSFSQAVNLAQLRWRDWGRPSAMFTGITRGFHLPLAHIRVGGVVFRIRTVGGRRVYTRLRSSSQFGTSTVVLDTR